MCVYYTCWKSSVVAVVAVVAARYVVNDRVTDSRGESSSSSSHTSTTPASPFSPPFHVFPRRGMEDHLGDTVLHYNSVRHHSE
mmetsp:Transcript_30158/g.42087  ORF Transcript_30158/g.42087 Transcript_30158/m.42087 type:complete len:83 (+) Transcript_30158:123-371(+)